MPVPTRAPLHCRQDAFDLLASTMPMIESDAGLLGGAVAIARHELPDVTIDQVRSRIDAIAQQIRRRVRSDRPDALLAHAHAVLFEDLGFAGNVDDYYNPRNSYLPVVLQTRRGLPITLCLIYKLVLGRLGLRVHGVNAPLHFMTAVDVDNRRLLIDPFCGGRLLGREEAYKRLAELTGQGLPPDVDLLPIATHRQWLNRMIANLINVYSPTGRRHDLSAMLELRKLLERGA